MIIIIDKEVLMLPSELLEQGWCQHSIGDDQGGVCLIGAALMGQANMGEFLETASELLRHHPDFHGNRVHWNNDPNRTQAEVVALAKLVEIKMGLRPVETEAAMEEKELAHVT